MTATDRYTLFDARTNEPLSMHPNREGARLSSLFHVNNGDKIYWREIESDMPVTVATDRGFVDGEERFRIAFYE